MYSAGLGSMKSRVRGGRRPQARGFPGVDPHSISFVVCCLALSCRCRRWRRGSAANGLAAVQFTAMRSFHLRAPRLADVIPRMWPAQQTPVCATLSCLRFLRESIIQTLQGACADFDRVTLDNNEPRNLAMLQCRLQPCGHRPYPEATRRSAKSWMPGVVATSWVQTLQAHRKVQSEQAELASLKPAGGVNLPWLPALDPSATNSLLDKILYICQGQTISTSRKGSKDRGNIFKTIYF